jgi:hypothetical protein
MVHFVVAIATSLLAYAIPVYVMKELLMSGGKQNIAIFLANLVFFLQMPLVEQKMREILLPRLEDLAVWALPITLVGVLIEGKRTFEYSEVTLWMMFAIVALSLIAPSYRIAEAIHGVYKKIHEVILFGRTLPPTHSEPRSP